MTAGRYSGSNPRYIDLGICCENIVTANEEVFLLSCDAAKLNNKNQQENSEIEQRAKEKSAPQGAAHSFPCCQAEKEQV